MSRTPLRYWILGCLLMAAGCLSEPGPKNGPVLDENARPSRPDTAGLRSRPRDTLPGQSPPKPADTLLPEIAQEGRTAGSARPPDKF